ncbi:Uncharacterized protein OBRU01_00555, partial [Operophtera brumata]
YGTGALQTEALRPRRSTSEPAPLSPDSSSPHSRSHSRLSLVHDMEALQKERDDLHQQVISECDLEAANRQLRSTRQFVEEQASEREAERDEFARRLAELRDENTRLGTRLQSSARIVTEVTSEREAERDEFARRLAELRDENTRLGTRLQSSARILTEVEQLEAQTREMNQLISELETRKASTDDELKANEEKVILLRDIIANLENQLEQKNSHEKEILEQLETMKKTIDERDCKMRSLLGELESVRSERAEQSDVICIKCGQEEDKYNELIEKVKEQLCGVWECVRALERAEDAALKRLADLDMQRAALKDVAQEVRAERDVLQARMSEQALRISSLSARLQQQRNDAEALSHQATSELSVQLHDALAEVPHRHNHCSAAWTPRGNQTNH